MLAGAESEKSLNATKSLFKDLSPFSLRREALERGASLNIHHIQVAKVNLIPVRIPQVPQPDKTSQICMTGNSCSKHCAHISFRDPDSGSFLWLPKPRVWERALRCCSWTDSSAQHQHPRMFLHQLGTPLLGSQPVGFGDFLVQAMVSPPGIQVDLLLHITPLD